MIDFSNPTAKAKLEEFLTGIMEPDEIEKMHEDQRAARIQEIADAQIFFDVFGTGRGPELLELLKEKTVYASTMNRTSAIIEGDIPLNPGEFMAGREMQNALVRWIEHMVKLSQEKVE